jgi:outer membrane protein assembly factor BamB
LWDSKRLRFIAAGVFVLLAALALGGYLYERHRTGSIYNPNARFVPQASPKPPARDAQRSAWPLYGYTPNHTRFFPAPPRLFPPFKQIWVRGGRSLLEFPPVIQRNRIFQLADDGVLTAFDLNDGHTVWHRRLGALSASTPAAVGGTVYATVLSRSDGAEAGEVLALAAATGRTLWSRKLPSRSESSPLVWSGRVFFGSQNGTVYALNARHGSLIWTYHAAGAVKASPTLSGGVLYFGDYSGHLQAVSARTGRRLWDSGSEGALLGSGTFYSTAAVMYGRVFLGNTDGRIYAYDASSGRLDWAVQTGAYVYASPAVTNAPGLGPTIYEGSYDGTFYALNARTGHIDWTFHAGGRISGSATIIGRVVYFADLGTHRTYGLGISTGRVVFKMGTGSFDPVVSDGQNIYLTGSTGLYGLTPVDDSPVQQPASPRARAARSTQQAASPHAQAARSASPAGSGARAQQAKRPTK